MIEKRDVQLDAPGEPGAVAPVNAAAEQLPVADAAQAVEGAPEAPKTPTPEKPPMSEETASLMGLIDRLAALLERSDLDELEVESGQTGIVLRKPSALVSVATVPGAAPAAPDAAGGQETAPKAAEPAPAPTTRSVRAPLTGIFYGASSPGAPAYVTVGQQIAVGHVIGLIEAMKLFNEIKSDTAGRVVRVVAETGKLVKAKQPLIEVEP
ncbi:MAG TPA: biotin/lipoyl-containing protein [Candidatus Limnocylindrales bacterium]